MKFRGLVFIFALFAIALFFATQIPQTRQFLPNFLTQKQIKFKTLNLNDLQNLPDLQVGDLVFRLGDEFDSVLIAQMSEFDYSHVGVVVETAPLRIIHAISDERTGENGVVESSIDEFLSHARKFGAARMKFLSDTQKQNLANALNSHIGEKFILAKKDEPNLYCTTFIEREIAKIYPNFTPSYTQFNAPIFRGQYLTPKAIAHFEGVEMIYKSE